VRHDTADPLPSKGPTTKGKNFGRTAAGGRCADPL